MGEGAPIQRWVQLAGYALIIATALAVLRPFLVPLAWAAILAFATWRISERVRHALGGRAALAAALMTALVVLLIVIPAVLLSLALAAEIGRTFAHFPLSALTVPAGVRSEEPTSELQSRPHLVCRLLLLKNKRQQIIMWRT